uniref:regulator of G-protein signaling 11 isoform X6 n=1 Tax=Nyctereutes procyonoides TaxID=34880 RepID=UPI002444EC33|nr:regulator of G-protein signaling 11 isoform X6 [Nyctereutes procyonoides]
MKKGAWGLRQDPSPDGAPFLASLATTGTQAVPAGWSAQAEGRPHRTPPGSRASGSPVHEIVAAPGPRRAWSWVPGLPGGEEGQSSVSLQAVDRQAGAEAPPGQPSVFPREQGRWTTPGVGRAQEVPDTLPLHHTRHPISGRAPWGQPRSWTTVSEEERAGLGPLSALLYSQAEHQGGGAEPALAWPPVLPAIYLAKKNIRKQGALVGHEKEHYDQLHRKMSHAWDLVVVQAREQLRAAKQRRKGDRLVIACQERTYWLVNRPPTQSPEFYRQEVEHCRKALARTRVKSSVCLEAYLNFSSQRGPHDPFLSGCLPSNPWVTDDDTYWMVNAPSVAVPTKLRVERWGFSFQELLGDPVGRAHFLAFLGTEFSAENLSFWEACEELRYGGQAQVPALVDSVYQQFLAPGAARWVNVDSRTMERTLAGLRRPHRYVLDDAQLHIYMLMKKDSYPRFLKSAAYRDLLADAVVPAEARRRAFPFLRKPPHPSPSPALLPASTSAEPVAATSDPACGNGGT